MNKVFDKQMGDIVEEGPHETGYGGRNEDIGYDSPYGDPKGRKKSLFLGVAVVLILIVLALIFFRTGSRSNKEDIISIRAGLNRIGERLVHVEEIEKRIALLEEKEKELRQSISKLDSSGRLLKGQLDKLAKSFEERQKSMASVSPKAKKPSAGKEATSGAKARYHVVSRGDNLYSIARKYNLSVKELCRLNQISQSQPIRPGQRLLVASSDR
jgi:LysM repeat protein